jgi:tRNA nucleotidyltransferase (CCA-adding enzyme)
MKGIDVYGAEIRVGGFSGYLCELLVLHCGSFVDVLEAFARHRERIVVDIEGHYRSREKEVNLLFSEPLVVVDPVDKARNVASAVQSQKLYDFVAAAQAFLKTPSAKFFYPTKTRALSIRGIEQRLQKRGSAVVFVVFEGVETVPDVLWGQLYKSQRSLQKLMELNDFKLLRDAVWSDEKSLNMFVFELEHWCISPVKLHLGPPLERESECERFIAKYVDNADAVCGPYVKGGRWVVLVRRRFTDACTLLKEKLRDGGRNAGVAEGVSQTLKKGFDVLVNEEIARVYERNKEFAVFLTEFLSGRPKWLEAA